MVTSARNVFLFAADPVILGITGYLLIAFGVNHLFMAHLPFESNWTYGGNQEGEVRMHRLTPYSTISIEENQRDSLSCVELESNLVSSYRNTEF